MKSRAFLIVWLLIIQAFWSSATERGNFKDELEQGNQLMLKGKYTEALPHYHTAISLEPGNINALFRRATVYLALGRSNNALSDFNTILGIDPNFVKALQQRALILIKKGKLQEALRDYTNENLKASDGEAHNKIADLEGTIKNLKEAKTAWVNGDCSKVVEQLGNFMEKVIWDPTLYLLRAKCHQKLGEIHSALNDVRLAAKLSQDNADLLLEASTISFHNGELDDSLKFIRDCLRVNPDHKKGFPFYKVVRKIVKQRDLMLKQEEEKEWDSCEKKGEELLKSKDLQPRGKAQIQRIICACQTGAEKYDASILTCSQAIEYFNEDDLLYVHRAKSYLEVEDFDAAQNDYEKASTLSPENNDAKEGKQKVHNLKKNIGRRDYYKILGVKRSATKREITKAYRKLAQKWHPDHYSNEVEKKRAERKFIEIAMAKEVLTDQEKRAMFDSGVDPNDSSQQQQHDPFQGFQGFNFGGPFNFGGRGFSFSF